MPFIVECGNGRVMALIRAAKDIPERFQAYRARLRELAPEFALSPADVDKMDIPVLVRLRLTPVDRRAFAEECNARTTIESSAIENARTDAAKITPAMLASLDVAENEAIGDALRAIRNKSFAIAFLDKLPAYEQASLVDAQGVLNQQGVRRIAMAIFVATFKGDVGIRLAEKFFESTDPNILNTFNGISRSLGLLSRVETLTAAGERQPEYAIGEDLAKAIAIYSAIAKTPGMTVEKYVAQQQLEARELTTFQERLLLVLDEHARSARRIAAIFSTYGQMVVDSPPPGQAAFMPEARMTKSQMFENAIKRVEDIIQQEREELVAKRRARELKREAVTAEDVVRLFETAKEPWEMTREEYIQDFLAKRKPTDKLLFRTMTERLDMEKGQHKIRVQQALSEGKPVPLNVLKDYPELVTEIPTGSVKLLPIVSPSRLIEMPLPWLARKLQPCNLSPEERALRWKPLRNIVTVAIGAGAKAQLCSVGMVAGIYELSLTGLSLDMEEKVLNLVMKTTLIKQVHTPVKGQRVFEVRVPVEEEARDLQWGPRELVQPRGERGDQAAMFKPVGLQRRKVTLEDLEWLSDLAGGVGALDYAHPDYQEWYDLSARAQEAKARGSDGLMLEEVERWRQLSGIVINAEGLLNYLKGGDEYDFYHAKAILDTLKAPVMFDPKPRWCYAVEETEKELGKLAKRLESAKLKIGSVKERLGAQIQVCRGQKEMFEEGRKPVDYYEVLVCSKCGSTKHDAEIVPRGDGTNHVKYTCECGDILYDSRKYDSLEMEGNMADKKTDTIRISGKCTGDSIETCIFRIRRVGKTQTAQGQRQLADALEEVLDRHTKRRKAAVGEEAEMGKRLMSREQERELYNYCTGKHNPQWLECQRRLDRLMLDKPTMAEPKLPYARPVPKQIVLYARTIEKHYMDSVVCDPKSIRVLKPEPNVLLYRCKLGGKWQTLKSIVDFTKVSSERRKRYFDDLKYWKADGVPVRIRKGSGVEPKMEDPELEEVKEAMKAAEVANEQ